MMYGVVLEHNEVLGLCGRAYAGEPLKRGQVFVPTRNPVVPFSLLGTLRVWRAKIGCVSWPLRRRVKYLIAHIFSKL